MADPDWVKILSYGSTAVQFVLVGQLCRLGIVKEYPLFTAFLAVYGFRSISLFFVPDHNYAQVWMTTEAVIVALQIACCWEAWRRLAEHYRLGVWLLFTGVGTGLAISVVRIWGDLDAASLWVAATSLKAWAIAIQCNETALASFLGVALLVSGLLQIKASANDRYHARILTAYFAFAAILHTSMIRDHGLTIRAINIVAGSVEIGCYFLWIAILSRDSKPMQHEDTGMDVDRSMREWTKITERIRPSKLAVRVR